MHYVGGGAHNFLVCEVSFSSKFLCLMFVACLSAWHPATKTKFLSPAVTATHENHVELNIIDIDLTRTPWPASFINKVDRHVA